MLFNISFKTFRHPVTGQVISINDALEQGFVKATEGGDYITTKAVKETKSFTITGAIDPKTGRKVCLLRVHPHQAGSGKRQAIRGKNGSETHSSEIVATCLLA